MIESNAAENAVSGLFATTEERAEQKKSVSKVEKTNKTKKAAAPRKRVTKKRAFSSSNKKKATFANKSIFKGEKFSIVRKGRPSRRMSERMRRYMAQRMNAERRANVNGRKSLLSAGARTEERFAIANRLGFKTNMKVQDDANTDDRRAVDVEGKINTTSIVYEF